MRKVVFAHGLSSSPDGVKALYLKKNVGAISPALGRLGLRAQMDALESLIADNNGSVLVGSSLGGLAGLGVANRSPNLVSHLVLLAPAMSVWRHQYAFEETEKNRPGLYGEAVELAKLSVPMSVSATIIQGMEDDVVLFEDVTALAARSGSSRLILVHDDHRLSHSTELILSVVKRAALDSDPIVSFC